MRNLFVIDGAAGTGKTDLLDFVRDRFEPAGVATVVPKYTTRPRRREEKARNLALDLRFVTRKVFDQYAASESFYTYEYGGHRYGFAKTDITTALERYNNVFIIVRDRLTILRLIDEFSVVQVIPTFIYSDQSQIRARLNADGYSRSAINFRLRRQRAVFDDYLKQSSLYQQVILNNSDKRDFQRLIQDLLDDHTIQPSDEIAINATERYHLVAALRGHRAPMLDRLRRYPFERNVFLMMKFRDANRPVFDFIKESLATNGLNCVRADDSQWQITRDVYNPIAVLYCCKYGIALFDEAEPGSTYNPNVAYELGMMHLQGKECLILRHSSLPQVPFDLIKNLHKRYTRDLELRQLIGDWLAEINQRGA